MTDPISENYRARFGGIARLYGAEALPHLHQAHFVVIGLGGVGTWTAEALARTGIGTLTLIELDEVCVTNTNRQLHALASTVGQSKNAVIAQRLKDINPEIVINSIHDFLDRKNLSTLISKEHHVVIDATDSAHVKAALIAYCSAVKLRLITVGSSGGKLDPTKIVVTDLGRTIADPMLAKVRQHLHRHHNFTNDTKRKYRVDAIYSTEQMIYPKPDGSVCQVKKMRQSGIKLDCAGGFGSSVMITGSFGFAAAARAVERYLQKVMLQEITL